MNWIDSHRRVDKGVTVCNCRMDCLLFAEESVLHAWIFAIGSLARMWSVSEGTKISSEKIGVLCLLRRPRQCFLQVSGNTLQQVETFLWWYLRVTEVGTKGLKHGYVKQTQFCVSFIASWWRNGSFQRTQSFQFSNRSLLRSSPMAMNLRWRLQKYCQRNERQRYDICEEFSVWHFVTKSTGLKSVKPRMSSHFSESRGPSDISSAMYPKCPRKEWRTKSFRLQSTPTGSGPKFVQGPGGVNTSPTFLGPVLVRSQQNYLKLPLIVRYFGSS